MGLEELVVLAIVAEIELEDAAALWIEGAITSDELDECQKFARKCERKVRKKLK